MCLKAVLLLHYSYSDVRPDDLSLHANSKTFFLLCGTVLRLCLPAAISIVDAHVSTNMKIGALALTAILVTLSSSST